jgi:hypothetical protein
LNFLYLLGPLELSRWQNNELRYSLRSLDTVFKYADIFIAGPEIPDFLSGITHIKVDIDPDLGKYKNMQRQLLAAVKTPDVPENLILMNDDFIMRSSPGWNWTPTVTPWPDPHKKPNKWRRSVIDTRNWLAARGSVTSLCYEGHTPMPFKKSIAKPLLEELLAAEKSLQFRSAYGNLVFDGGVLHPNAKRADPDRWPANTPFWSLKGRPNDKAKTFLEEWLSKPSRWEKSNGEMASCI